MSRPTCRYFLQGGCRYGSRCRFAHFSIVEKNKEEEKKEIPLSVRCRDCQGFRAHPDAKYPCYDCRKKCFSCGSQNHPETYCGLCQEEGPRCINCKKTGRLPNEYYCEPCQKIKCQFCGYGRESAPKVTTCPSCSKIHKCPIDGCANELIGDMYSKCSDCKSLRNLYRRMGFVAIPRTSDRGVPLAEHSKRFIVKVLYKARDELHKGYCSDPIETVTIHSEFIKDFPLHSRFDSFIEELIEKKDSSDDSDSSFSDDDSDEESDSSSSEEESPYFVRKEWVTPLETSCEETATKRWVTIHEEDYNVDVDGLPQKEPKKTVKLSGTPLPRSHFFFYDLGRLGCDRGSNYCGMGTFYDAIKIVSVPL